MVGHRSGLRSGTVIDTDYDYDVRTAGDQFGNPVYLLNVGIANLYAQEGDSGAPIFEWAGYGQNVVLRGMTVGLLTINGQNRTVFNSMIAMSQDSDEICLICEAMELRYGW